MRCELAATLIVVLCDFICSAAWTAAPAPHSFPGVKIRDGEVLSNVGLCRVNDRTRLQEDYVTRGAFPAKSKLVKKRGAALVTAASKKNRTKHGISRVCYDDQ